MINRPRLEDYRKGNTSIEEFDLSCFRYLKGLEKYCDKLEKSLDKACYWLVFDQSSLPLETIEWVEEDWKEWLLKDE